MSDTNELSANTVLKNKPDRRTRIETRTGQLSNKLPVTFKKRKIKKKELKK